jgi:F-type H+-transporting ATPase subunit b
MEETIRQLGGILLGSIPTVILLALLYFSYRFLVHKPLTAVLARRRAQTVGAIESARAEVAAAEQKTAEYEGRLREARATIFKVQEGRRKMLIAARMTAVAEAKAAAEARVERAKVELQGETEVAKTRLHSDVSALAAQIIRAILRPRAGEPGSVAGGLR